jgi:uncharacterized protein (DUF2267 family)
MDQLVQQVSSRTGLPEDQARKAVQACLDFLKEKLPAPASAAIDQALGSEQTAGAFGQAADAARGVFGKGS